MSELKPCPFCGDIAHVHPIDILNRYNRRWNVRCDNDKCIAGVVVRHFDTEQEAIEAWNTRYEPTCSVGGEWTAVSQTQERRLETCSFCGYVFGISECNHAPWDYEYLADIPNYCPNCGAKVVSA